MIWQGRRTIAVLLLAALLLVPAAAGTAPAPQPVRYVVIMSFDGARADAVRRVLPEALLARAAVSWEAKTTLPSTTLPAHTSMLTGVPPAVHGVRFNTWTPSRGYITLPTVFSVVTAQGGRAAAFVAKSKLLFLVPPHTAAHAEHVLYPRHDMVGVVQQAARYLAQHQPHLLFIHVADPDDQGHAYGWMSEPYLRAVRKMPEAIAVILDVLARMLAQDSSLVIVTADHGGHGRTHGTAAAEDVTIPWLAFGAVEPGLIRRPIVTYDTAATAIAALGMQIPSGWQGTPVLQTVERVR